MVCLCENEEIMIQPINSTDKQNKNIIPAGILGGAGAALISRVAPLSHLEHNRAFSKEVLAGIKEAVAQAKVDEFTKVAREVAVDESLDRMGLAFAFKHNKEAILSGAEDKIKDITKNFDEATTNAFKGLVKRVSDAGEFAKSVADHNVVKNAKKSRPAAYFAVAGAAIAMTAAIVKNAVMAKKVKDESVSISYDKEGMIIDAPDSLALAIVLDETI